MHLVITHIPFVVYVCGKQVITATNQCIISV